MNNMNTLPSLLASRRILTVASLTVGLSWLAATAPAAPGRATLSLDGKWQIEDSVVATDIPAKFTHTGPVPGMANLAKPPFKDVDLFDSRELISNRIRSKKLAESARVNTAGTPRQERNYFWYRKTFRAPAQRAIAMLKINKAQFGTAVWLNGKPLGEYPGCFTASYFNLTAAIRWKAENELLVRIGAHPGVLPDTFPTGTDFEKLKWTPGIYDRVSVCFCDNPVIETAQVAPRISASEIVVETKLKNYGVAGAFALAQSVCEAKGGKRVASADPMRVTLEAGEEKTVRQTLAIPDAHLWSPEDPFLYRLESSTGGDSVSTRFGMREFRTDLATKRFFLNGKPYYLRGSNITLHRFFEDPDCSDLPWNEKWLRKLLGEIPKKMHWNSFRFCIGPAPEQWLEIADETGLLIQNEFFVWTGAPRWDTNYFRKYNAAEMIRQYGDWMRDNWNHPSVAIWDANNETKEPLFAEKIIPAVRGLDLSDRPWENSYNGPPRADDPVEDHPYLFIGNYFSGRPQFKLSDLETMDGTGQRNNTRSASPRLLNEYGWLWLNRDGSPTLLTEKVYAQTLGTNATAEQRFAFDAYALAGLTEFWRAHRQYAGVLHFVYLTCSYPGVYTSDHWLDVKRLKLEPHFADYMAEAFKPLGVYVNFFQPTLKAGASREFTVMLVNDHSRPLQGKLALTLGTKSGQVLARSEKPFDLVALGDQTLQVALEIPTAQGDCVIRATATPDGSRGEKPTICRRWVSVVE